RELGPFAGREQAHLLGLQERNDFPVAEWRGDLHRRSLPHRVSGIIAAVGASTLAVKSAACHGVVAQLGERRVRNAKVGSSILLHSTKSPQVAVLLNLRTETSTIARRAISQQRGNQHQDDSRPPVR